MAGMPKNVVEGAERVLKRLENQSKNHKNARVPQPEEENIQLSLFQLEDPLLVGIRDELREMDINTLSPLDAFDKLRNLKKRLGL
jgi:DNA mismatch repair protein MutS